MRLSDKATLFHADCRDAIRTLLSDSLDSCVTDPPYALVSMVKRFANSPRTEASMPTSGPHARASRGFMGQKWDTGEVAFSAEFWAEVYRVLKPGAFVAAFGASRQYHRMACAIEDAGFEIRDSLMWIYGTGFPKSQDVSKFVDKELGAEREKVAPRSSIGHQRNIGNVRPYMLDPDHQTDSDIPATAAAEWEGWGTALKPAFEPIVLARKPLSEATVAANVLKWRTGALNIGASRVPAETREAKAGGMARKANPVYGSFAGVEEVSGNTDQGRWPANVVTDGSDEVVGMFPNSTARPVGSVIKKASAKGGTQSNSIGAESRAAGSVMTTYGDEGSAARFFYSAKASKQDRNGSKHPTVKPISLMEWLATLVTPPGGTILDPFAGSGTTGIAASNKGFNVILCERESEYVADIRSRFGSPRATLTIPLAAVRRELELAPTLAALRARLRA